MRILIAIAALITTAVFFGVAVLATIVCTVIDNIVAVSIAAGAVAALIALRRARQSRTRAQALPAARTHTLTAARPPALPARVPRCHAYAAAHRLPQRPR